MKDDKKFEIEGDIENEDYENSGKGGLIAALVIFIILFLAATGLLFYFQFYQNGQVKLSFKKRDPVDKEKLTAVKIENENLKSKLDSLEFELASKASNAYNQSPDTSGAGMGVSQPKEVSGTVFEVQVGAFQYFDPSQYDGQLTTNMTFDYTNGMVKITIGRFRDADIARQFRRDVVRMGIRDAFIVKKVDGVRQEIINP